MSEKLTDQARSDALAELEGWTQCTDRDAIAKQYKFKDFKRAFAWMTAVALEAEQADHHPEWENVYNRVAVTLTTHDVNSLTVKDVKLAKAMDRYADQLST